MGNNECGFYAENITFGIEVEVVAAGYKKGSIPHNVLPMEKILHDVAQRLIDDGLEVELVSTFNGSERPSYKKWVVTEDISIFYDPDAIVGLFPRLRCAQDSLKLKQLIHGGVEIVSPVFHLVPLQDWKAQISNLFHILKDNYRLHFNPSTGLHVHVGYGESEFPFLTLLNIASVLVLFEPVIEIWVHPGHRGVTSPNENIKSNRKNELLEDLTNLQVIDQISGCKTVAALQRVVNHAPVSYAGCSKSFKYNFMSLTAIGTIEFRQHAGTENLEDIQMWVLLCTALVRAAAAIDGETIRELASRQKLRLEDLSQLVGDKIVSYYRGKFLYELL
ncbi:hypothetical protein RUND412_005810 [Rhizina undulata]